MLNILAVQGELPDPSTVGPGTAAFVVFVLLLLAMVLLMRSMRKQLGRVDFPEQTPSESDRRAVS